MCFACQKKTAWNCANIDQLGSSSSGKFRSVEWKLVNPLALEMDI